MAKRPMSERIRVETGTKATTGIGGTTWVTTSTDTRWATCVLVSSSDAEKYQSIDGRLDFEFRFLDWPTVTMANTRFVWLTDGHPNYLKIYYPVKPPEKYERERRKMVVLVRDSGEVASA